jgi:hypothetical protein
MCTNQKRGRITLHPSAQREHLKQLRRELRQQQGSSRMDWKPLAFECSHSSGCHELFATLAEFQEHWKTKHQSPCVKKQCQFCGEVSEEINGILACGGYALNANQETKGENP